MQLTVPPDLETLINRRLSSGRSTGEECRALSEHIEAGYLQAERGDLLDGAQARRDIQAMKEDWRFSKR